MEPNQFLFIGDQFLKLNLYETFVDSFFKRRFDNLGVHNSFHMIVGFWDILFFFIVYNLGFSYQVMERILFTIVLFGSLSLSWFGFRKLHSLFEFNTNYFLLFSLTLWYIFNTYTLILWHGGVYNITSGITYSLLPFTFFYFHKVAFTDTKLITKIILALLLFIASFTFWVFAVTVFFYISYYLLGLMVIFISSRSLKSIINSLKSMIALALIYLPMSAFVIINIINEFVGKSGDNSVLYQPAFGNLQGGIMYQLLMRFSWGMYTLWLPRTSYSFAEYFFTPVYNIATLFLYFVILAGMFFYIRDRKQLEKNKIPLKTIQILLIVLLILFISLFLGKAHQPPLGELFLFIYEHVPFFSVFRSADIRFGLSTVFAVSLLLFMVSKYFNKYLLGLLLIIISLIQSYYLLNGIALKGISEESKFSDRIVAYSNDQIELANYLNSEISGTHYILPIPYVEAGHYLLDGKDYFIGQDLLPKIINLPFVYPSNWGTISSMTYRTLLTLVEDKAFENLKHFPIKYILLRNDTICNDCHQVISSDLVELRQFVGVFSNAHYDLYQFTNSPSLINSPNIKFKVINPVKYRILFENVSTSQPLDFLNSFNKSWKLYSAPIKSFGDCDEILVTSNNASIECSSRLRLLEGEELTYLFKDNLFEETHLEQYGYANTWAIDPEVLMNIVRPEDITLNPDGSINFSLVLYYKDQSYLYLSALISLLTIFGAVVYLIYNTEDK